jgi:hypothetical protein
MPVRLPAEEPNRGIKVGDIAGDPSRKQALQDDRFTLCRLNRMPESYMSQSHFLLRVCFAKEFNSNA